MRFILCAQTHVFRVNFLGQKRGCAEKVVFEKRSKKVDFGGGEFGPDFVILGPKS